MLSEREQPGHAAVVINDGVHERRDAACIGHVGRCAQFEDDFDTLALVTENGGNQRCAVVVDAVEIETAFLLCQDAEQFVAAVFCGIDGCARLWS